MKKSPVPWLALIIAFALTTVYAENDARGALVASVSTSTLSNDSPSESLQVFLTSDAPILDIGSINLYASIGNGLPGQTATPTFSSFTWNPAIVAAFDAPFFSGETPEQSNDFAANPQVFDFVSTEEGFDLGTSSTLLGTFTIDTTGIFDQTFTFFIGTSPGGGATSDVTDATSTTTAFALAGPTTFSVGASAVPEPGSMACLAGIFAAGGAYRVRKRRAAAALTAA